MASKFLLGGASSLKDEPWAQWTVKFGWPAQGVFPSGTDGSHVNQVNRAHNKDIIATADDWGLVNLYRWPCLQGGQAKGFRLHSEHVVRVQFTGDNSKVFSVGGYDQTLAQWKVL